MIVCVSGNPSVDRLFEVDELVAGAIHRPRRFLALPGGKGIHVAQVATALGAHAIATGILAGRAGRWIADTLAAEGVPTRFVWGAGETRSSLSVADRATGRLTEFYEDGTPARADELSALTKTVEALMNGASWLALAGSLPTETGIDGYPGLISIARRSGVRVAVDSRGEWLAGAVGSGADLVKINVDEAQEFLGRTIDDVAAEHIAATDIRARSGGDGHAVVITLGERGMVLVDPDGVAWHGASSARGRYPVGSGDAFLAGLLTALETGASWTQSSALGLGAAAANAEVVGAGRLAPERAWELAREATVEPLVSA